MKIKQKIADIIYSDLRNYIGKEYYFERMFVVSSSTRRISEFLKEIGINPEQEIKK